MKTAPVLPVTPALGQDLTLTSTRRQLGMSRFSFCTVLFSPFSSAVHSQFANVTRFQEWYVGQYCSRACISMLYLRCVYGAVRSLQSTAELFVVPMSLLIKIAQLSRATSKLLQVLTMALGVRPGGI